MNSQTHFFCAEILRIEGYDRVIVKWWWFVLPVIALMILLACWRMTVQVIQWWLCPKSNAHGLFRQLARLHELNADEKSLISHLKPMQPNGAPVALLFADPSSWDWSKLADSKEVESLEKLYLKIFGFPRDQDET